MKQVLALLLLVLTALGMQVSPALSQPLNDAQLDRYLARVGFDPSPAELNSYKGLSQSQLAQRLVTQAAQNSAVPAVPDWVSQPAVSLQTRGNFSQEERMDYRTLQNRQTLELREWWLRGMIATPTPLRERMVLFWHNHFPSSQQKVVDSQMLWQQHQVMRQHVLGDFKFMLKGVVQSPAMIEYLDASQNRAQAPNENLARELMELFTLGEGNYTEADVKQAAKALTGWGLNRATNGFQINSLQHDSSAKTVLGLGLDSGDNLLVLLLSQPQTAQWITQKLWKEFISPTPDVARVNALARKFYVNGYDVAALMAALLAEPALLADANQASLVKSPVELIVGTVRRFGIAVPNERALLQPLNAMGQVLFSHPSVKGWGTGEAWINANTLLARKQAIAALIAAPASPARNASNEMGMQAPPAMVDGTPTPRPAPSLRFNPDAWLAQLQMPVQRSLNPAELFKLSSHVLHTAPAAPLDSSLEALPALKALMSDIAYQVK
jgi:uncharacterized protein (DUF1800 family)